jgi:ATP-dependent DNA helicase PIF1
MLPDDRRAKTPEAPPSPKAVPETLDAWAADPAASAVRVIRDMVRSGASVLVAGAAGTGKSTLLRLVSHEIPSAPVLAPTGVAALRVGGQTLHSYFRLERGVQYMGEDGKDRPMDLYRAASTIICDEISMVRADVFDKIDAILRRARASDEPFGGAQILMFGDLLQLPPVVGRDEEAAFRSLGYSGPHVFQSAVMRRAAPATVLLDRVHRQRDSAFVDVLNAVRRGEATPAVLGRLNRRVLRGARAQGDLSLVVATRRFKVEVLNQQRLHELPTPMVTYCGTIEGHFPPSELPAPFELGLRPGARVMFVKNHPDGHWANGTLGVVLESRRGSVLVLPQDRQTACHVHPVAWERHTYAINRDTGKPERRIVGRYVQLPLVLGWAATVHKCQGLTLDRTHVDLGTRVFAPGQTYVAISRCRSEPGLTLERPIRAADLRVDAAVLAYMRGRAGRAA